MAGDSFQRDVVTAAAAAAAGTEPPSASLGSAAPTEAPAAPAQSKCRAGLDTWSRLPRVPAAPPPLQGSGPGQAGSGEQGAEGGEGGKGGGEEAWCGESGECKPAQGGGLRSEEDGAWPAGADWGTSSFGKAAGAPGEALRPYGASSVHCSTKPATWASSWGPNLSTAHAMVASLSAAVYASTQRAFAWSAKGAAWRRIVTLSALALLLCVASAALLLLLLTFVAGVTTVLVVALFTLAATAFFLVLFCAAAAFVFSCTVFFSAVLIGLAALSAISFVLLCSGFALSVWASWTLASLALRSASTSVSSAHVWLRQRGAVPPSSASPPPFAFSLPPGEPQECGTSPALGVGVCGSPTPAPVP